ncbi:hypothetical protein TeGR_g7292 [Tetraparma gracilis]|uniref:Uncharacterized protein n=1 Tax=Tetraparma gracilis TaxID=2962635 RepID=A0ABQ6MZT6_9STRA|nr:hypothetical protein TeGR_g7292 [Tetraparma gracilis]
MTVTPSSILHHNTTAIHPLPPRTYFDPAKSKGSYSSSPALSLLSPPSPLTPPLLRLLSLHSSRGLIVGLPLHKDGAPSLQSSLVRSFLRRELLPALVLGFGGRLLPAGGGRLRVYPALPVVLLDERFSSKAASAANNFATAGLDSDAAALILEDYLGEPRGEVVFAEIEGGGGEEAFFRGLLEEREGRGREGREEREREGRERGGRETRSEMIRRVEAEEGGAGGGGKMKKKKKKARRKVTKTKIDL